MMMGRKKSQMAKEIIRLSIGLLRRNDDEKSLHFVELNALFYID